MQAAHGLFVPGVAELLVDDAVVLGQVHALLARGLQGLRAPQDAAGVVLPQRGEHKAFVVPHVLEAAVNPGRHAGNVARADLSLERLGVEAPVQVPAAFGAHKNLGREVHVRRVDLARGHGHTTHLEAMLFSQAHRLVRVLRHARPDQRVVLFGRAARNAVVKKGLGAVAQAVKGNKTFADLGFGQHGGALSE